jgi:hypothetical protein
LKPSGVFFSDPGVEVRRKEKIPVELLHSGALFSLLVLIDLKILEIAWAGRCSHCGGRLDAAHYKRKPRGLSPDTGPGDWSMRWSLCCREPGCRKRLTPPSVRFAGRRVYVAATVTLLAAMVQGVTPARARSLREQLGLDRRTLKRWLEWWTKEFPRTSLWRELRARIIDPVGPGLLPASLRKVFGTTIQATANLLVELSPLSSATAQGVDARRVT